MEIYKTTNKITGDYYIGKNNNSSNIYYIGSGKFLKQQIKEYGKENFKYEILITINEDLERGYDLLSFIEHLIIMKYIRNEKCINLSTGSENAISEYYKKPEVYIMPEKIWDILDF